MSTRLLSLLLALSLLWPACMSLAGSAPAAHAGAAVRVATDAEPAALAEASAVADPHETPAPPAAGDGGSPGERPGHEPSAQGVSEAAAEPLALLAGVPQAHTPPLTMAPPAALGPAASPAPHPDGLKRPPRPAALPG